MLGHDRTFSCASFLALLALLGANGQTSEWVLRGDGFCEAGLLQGGVTALDACQTACQDGNFECLSVYWLPIDLECYVATSHESCSSSGGSGQVWDFVVETQEPDDDDTGGTQFTFLIITCAFGAAALGLIGVSYCKRKTICPKAGIKKMTEAEVDAAAEDPIFQALLDNHLERYYSKMKEAEWNMYRILDARDHLQLIDDGFPPEVARRIYNQVFLMLQSEVYTVVTVLSEGGSTRANTSVAASALSHLPAELARVNSANMDQLAIPISGDEPGALAPKRLSSDAGSSRRRALSPGEARRVSRGESQPGSPPGSRGSYPRPVRGISTNEGQPSQPREDNLGRILEEPRGRSMSSNEGQPSRHPGGPRKPGHINTPKFPRGSNVESSTEDEFFSNQGDTVTNETAGRTGEVEMSARNTPEPPGGASGLNDRWKKL